MEFTTRKPSRSGYYWYREDFGQGSEWIVAKVWLDHKRSMWLAEINGGLRYLDDCNGRWGEEVLEEGTRSAIKDCINEAKSEYMNSGSDQWKQGFLCAIEKLQILDWWDEEMEEYDIE